MPQEERTLILLPRAMDQATIDNPTLVGVRQFQTQLYVRRVAYFTDVELVDVRYSPAWAKFQVALFQSGVELQRYAGNNGLLEIGVMFDDSEPLTVVLENNSIDTDVRVTLRLRGWQYGEV